MKECKFQISDDTMFSLEWFDKNYSKFPYFARSIENFVVKINTAQATKKFGQIDKSSISDETIQCGYRM